jgi:dihydrofolate reductase
MVSIVVAVAENGVIGSGGDLPWRLSGDLQRFKQLTMGHALVMGRKTYKSIGRPLPGRTTIVLTTQREFDPGHAEVLVANSLDEAVALVSTTDCNPHQVFVVGGAEIYELSLAVAARLYRTVVHGTPTGDTYFPPIDFAEWHMVEQAMYPADDKNDYACTWQMWERHETC